MKIPSSVGNNKTALDTAWFFNRLNTSVVNILDQRLAVALQQRREQHLYRTRRITSTAQGPEMVIDGRQCLSFCSNDYLGLANHPDVIKALQVGAQRYGVGSGASHLINGHTQAHHALEEELAAFVQRPRALLFSTGYMANLGVVSALTGKGDTVLEDRLNHASLIDAGLLSGARLQRYLHGDPQSLANHLQKHEAGRNQQGTCLVMTDGVFSMDGDMAPLPALAQTAAQHQAVLMVDDAHGFGVMGESGRGTLEYYNLKMEQVPVLMCTLGKGLGTFGAFVAGSEVLIETLIQLSRSYIYTTALPAAVAEATRASLRVLQAENWRRDKLHALIQRFKSGAAQLGLNLLPSVTPIQPLLLQDSDKALQVSETLWREGIFISAIRPPTVPAGSARLRITLSAMHSEAQVDRLLQALEQHA